MEHHRVSQQTFRTVADLQLELERLGADVFPLKTPTEGGGVVKILHKPLGATRKTIYSNLLLLIIGFLHLMIIDLFFSHILWETNIAC